MIAQNKENKQEIEQLTGKEPLKGKREKFAQEIAKGDCNHTEAARIAKYSNHKGLKKYAYLLSTIPEVKARIAYLKAKTAEKYNITRDTQVKQYRDVVEVCDETGDMANKNKALNSIDKLFGLSIDKQQTDRSEAQTAYDTNKKRLGAQFAKWQLEQSLARPEALEAVNVVDITGDDTV